MVIVAATGGSPIADVGQFSRQRDSSAVDTTIEQIQQQVEQQRQLLRSVYFEAEGTGRTLFTPAGTQRRRRVVVAIESGKRYAESLHLRDGLDWTDDPDWTKTYLTDAGISALWVINRYCEQSRRQLETPIADKFRYEFFIECTGWWPVGEDRAPNLALHRALAESPYIVHPQSDILDQHRCVVVERPGQDKIWLDVDRGCCVVRRELAADGMEVIYENSDLREVAPGVWLPWKLHRIMRRSGRDRASSIATNWSDSTRTISHMTVNALPADIFKLRLEPGTLVHDTDQHAHEQIPGGSDLLDNLAKLGRKLLASRPHISAPISLSALSACYGVWLCLAAIAIAPWVWRVGRRLFDYRMTRLSKTCHL